MNRISIIGRVTKETETNQSGRIAANSIAVDRVMKDQNGNKVTDFINIRWLGEKKSQFAQKYIHKGMKIGVSGSLCVDNYKDKDGNSKQYVYVMVDETDFCDGKSQQLNGNQNTSSAGDGFMSVPDGNEDELPFN